VYPHRSLELFRFTLDAHPSGSLEKLIDLSGSELSKWRGASACLCDTRRETYAIWNVIGLDMNLEDLAMTRSLGEESCARLVKKDMEYHVVIIGVLTVPVLLPIDGAKVELDVALELRAAVDPDARPDEVWPGFPVPEAELHHLDESAVRRAEVGAACSRVPESLPLQFGPLVLLGICGFADQGEVGLEAF
jgi:hypothetical protein